MAYHSARPRDRLLDEGLNEALAKRGMELIGLFLLVATAALGWALWSYTPDMPTLLAPSDVNQTGLAAMLGATIASLLLLGFGLGAWVLVLFGAVWSLRLMLHTGAARFWGRFFPLLPTPFVAGVHFAAFAAPESWTWGSNPGLGGTFGDAFLGLLVMMAPDSLLPVWFKMLSFMTGLALLGFLAVALGLTWGEFRRILATLRAGFGLMLRGLGGFGAGLRHGVSALASGLGRSDRHAPLAEDTYPDEVWGAGYAEAPMAPAEPPRSFVPPAPSGADWMRQAPVAAVPKAPDTPREESMTTLSSDNPWAVPVPKPGILNRAGARRAAQRPPEPEIDEPLIEQPDPDPEPRESFITQAVRRRLARMRAPDPEPAPSDPPDAPQVPRMPQMPGFTGARREPPLMGRDPMPQEHLPGFPSGDRTDDGTGAPPDLSSTIADAVMRARRQVPPVPSAESDPAMVLARQPQRPKTQLSSQARAEAQPSLFMDDTDGAYAPPPLALLSDPTQIERPILSREELERNAKMLEDVLGDYGVKGEIVNFRAGPVVTLYELEPAPGLKASRVIGLADDIARSMSALSARVSTMPGRSVIGIELPNVNRETVVLREILSGRDFGDSTLKLPLALGKDIGGETVVANLTKMPHLLIAGTTGSGKSVAINTMILSLLYKLSPDECRMIMIDPKMLELSVYDGIPHLLSPVVTDPKKAVVALKWVVSEMEERYRKMSKMGVRNIDGYNTRVRETLARGEMFSRTVQTGFDEDTGEPIFETEQFEPKTLPYIVVVVDEMADLMMVAGKEIEACIQRLAQMARASGIHLIMATQRPSVDVITGTIKANFPTRISFQVTSKVDSRTILGEQGAEQLLGMGDMLYMAGGGKITRVHGPFVSDFEVEEVVSHLKSYGPPDYVGGVVEGPDDDVANSVDQVLGLGSGNGEDQLYDQAVQIVLVDRKCSTSYIQRKLAIGYNKAARLVERMEDEGVVSAANHVGKREILVPAQPQ